MNIEEHPTVKRMHAIARAPIERKETGSMPLGSASWPKTAAPAASSRKVHMPVEDTLTQGEKERGYILACQALAESDVVIES